jgi:hypothetical protein
MHFKLWARHGLLMEPFQRRREILYTWAVEIKNCLTNC